MSARSPWRPSDGHQYQLTLWPATLAPIAGAMNDMIDHDHLPAIGLPLDPVRNDIGKSDHHLLVRSGDAARTTKGEASESASGIRNTLGDPAGR